MQELPKKYQHQDVEARWAEYWENAKSYRWDASQSRDETFVVDTPPPTVSGSLHVGHVFSYTHTDLIVRYQRMRGKNIMYPMGWDDNGLPTERRVQNKFGITCSPELPYDPAWQPAPDGAERKHPEAISRRNFIEACTLVTSEDEKAFESLWRHLGLSVEWQQQYATIDEHCRATSQRSFLDLIAKGLVYSVESPTMWDVTFQTALAQADIEDRPQPGAYHDVRFGIDGGGSFVISTTRPELIVSVIAVVAHPDDERYQPLFGKSAITPLFHARVPILPSTHADPEKGSGIMMVSTFGDAADVEWWRSSGLPIKQVINRAGRFDPVDFTEEPFVSVAPEKAKAAYDELVGKTVKQVRKRVAELLAEEGSAVDGQGAALVGALKPIEHPVKFYEKGDLPVEFVTTRQWFIRLLDHKQELLAQGEKIQWHPPHMQARYSNWVEGLNYDWCISRQRFFGVPFPVWYPISTAGEVLFDEPIFADPARLPVDPLSEAPPGYQAEQRGEPGGFAGDPDIMDTWATSSLTPQIVSKWGIDEQRHRKLFPMDMRPQSHEIIRTWAFYTIAKAWMHEREIS
ncbi:MAG: valine--tRNA ligase [Bdellovibrionales bacterium]|nr:valine--tRNA ligase [Bdellovibrionales bacterium]